MSPQATSSCSVILYTENRRSACVLFLTSLAEQVVLPQQLIIVDSSHQSLTQDSTIQQLLKDLEHKNIHIIYQYIGAHAVYSRNQAVAQATGKILYFFDATIILDKDYINAMQIFLLNHSCYAGAMGKICAYEQEYSWMSALCTSAFWMSYVPTKRLFTTSGSYAYPHALSESTKVRVLDSSCMVFRRAIFAKHTFHENLRHDQELQAIDFSYRMSCYAPLVYYPEARAWSSDEQYQNQKKEQITYAAYLFFTYVSPHASWRTIIHYWFCAGYRLTAWANQLRAVLYARIHMKSSV